MTEPTTKALAEALHENCLADYARRPANSVFTQHMADAHYERAQEIKAALAIRGITLGREAEAVAAFAAKLRAGVEGLDAYELKVERDLVGDKTGLPFGYMTVMPATVTVSKPLDPTAGFIGRAAVLALIDQEAAANEGSQP